MIFANKPTLEGVFIQSVKRERDVNGSLEVSWQVYVAQPSQGPNERGFDGGPELVRVNLAPGVQVPSEVVEGTRVHLGGLESTSGTSKAGKPFVIWTATELVKASVANGHVGRPAVGAVGVK